MHDHHTRHRHGTAARGRRSALRALAAAGALAAAASCTAPGAGPDGGAGASPSPSPSPSAAPEPVVRADLEEVFDAAGITGTFALLDTGSGELTVVEPEMAAERAAPASTFKIANSLIALDAGAVADVDEVVPFTGGPQPNPEWEHDMSMREALPISAYPIFQELARRVGPEEMAARVEQFGYGNADIGGPDDIDSFWLEGPLAISAVEQVRFVSDVVTGGLPVDPAHVDAVRPLLRDDELSAEGGPTVYGKTGWSDKVDPDVGWFVGWVDDGSAAPHAFALRIDMDDDGDVEQRRPLTEELLTRLGVLPPSGS